MITTTISCVDCSYIFDFSFNSTRILLKRESGRAQLEDAELEQAEQPEARACPACCEKIEPVHLVGVMADCIEESYSPGVIREIVEREVKYRSER